MSIDGGSELLRGWAVEAPHGAHAPVRRAAAILEQFGAERVDGPDRAAGRLRVLPNRQERGWDAELTGWTAAQSTPTTAYAALRMAGLAALAARRRRDTRLRSRTAEAEIAAAVELPGGTRPELIRCLDGWVVLRRRDDGEAELLRALAGEPERCARAELVERARMGRLLIAPVEPPARAHPGAALGVGCVHGAGGLPRGRRPRVLDWSVLWAGPWTAEELRRSGSVVQRVEHPRRRDGLLSWPEGRQLWRRLNGRKRTALLDARHGCDRERLTSAIVSSDVLITSMTPRALGSLGFDDDWRQAHAPHVLHIELVAFEPPWHDSPGLGEHAAAQAGLLWRDGDTPAPPAPWADPLLGAAALALAQIWLASADRPGGRVRLSLERAASLAVEVAG